MLGPHRRHREGELTEPAGPGADSARSLEFVLEHIKQTLSALAEEIKDVGPGWVARTPSFPAVWVLNQLHITGAASADEVLALADEHQAGLPFRHIRVDNESTAAALTPPPGTGWRTDREVVMVLPGPTSAGPTSAGPAAAIVELGQEQATALMRRWLKEDFPNIDAASLDQLDEYIRREGRLWNERSFGILNQAGQPVAITKLRSRQGTAWVEDVYTVPEERRQGFARTLVTHAAGLARSGGHDLTFIIADDNDWPKHLYQSIGFRPVGLTWTFHRNC